MASVASSACAPLGVQITDANRPGALVVDVVPGGAAEKGGVRRGDLITKLGDRAIQDADELIAAVRSHTPGDRVKLVVVNNGGERTVDVTLTGEKG